MLVQHIGRLEYDIYGEIGVPYTKVAILSMHQADDSTCTNVLFGFLPDPIDAPTNPVSLSVLRSSLIELFLQQSNLTLTPAFGQPSSLEILKYPGGITIIPDQSAYIWQISQILFNFTLHNTIYEIKEYLTELKQQLKLGLRLRPYENVFVQLTNQNGSTRDPPVTVQAAVMSDLGSLLPQRLRQLAQFITGSPFNNLGLNNTVFGNVKEVSLSSFLNQTIIVTAPTPSPAPAPEQTNYAQRPISSSPSISPSDPPAPHRPENHPHHSSPPISRSPAPSVVHKCTPRRSPTPKLSPGPPLPIASYSSPRQEKGSAKGLVSPPLASPPILPSTSCKFLHHVCNVFF
ncbi:hypothetical protein C3L33_22337, partial [Rhododendron williamsianum]